MASQSLTTAFSAVSAAFLSGLIDSPASVAEAAVGPTLMVPAVSVILPATCGLIYYRRENVYNVGRGTRSLLRKAKHKIGSGCKTIKSWFFRSINSTRRRRASAIRDVFQPDFFEQVHLRSVAEINRRTLAHRPPIRSRSECRPERVVPDGAIRRSHSI